MAGSRPGPSSAGRTRRRTGFSAERALFEGAAGGGDGRGELEQGVVGGDGHRPTRRPPHASADDLTAKARIRNAALELHAAKGEANTTVREVAKAAGVTHGLVVHHFSSKEGLRRSVHEYVLDRLRESLVSVPAEGSTEDVRKARDAVVARMFDENPAVWRYIHRSMLDPVQPDTELLALVADFTLGQVRELRAAGIGTSAVPEYTQAIAVIVRELAPRLLAPVVDQLWAHLTGGSAEPAPGIEVRVGPSPSG
ncbi:TetR/AcrR family transcriptional regulator [Streptomyces sp. NPDC051018]|uniref:TetR/AcrR family transcriptional regulator n=1 Tax=Streptomyces sp. NPDC051018 TaxID=3365639 RepID=UPI0037A40AB7